MMPVEFGEEAEIHISNIPSAQGVREMKRRGAGVGTGAILRAVRLLLVALWLGAAVYFSFAVAPSAFAVLPSRELAGALVTRTLSIVNVGGFIVAVLALLTTPLGWRAAGRVARWVEVAALVVLAAATAIGHWGIAARLREMRAAMRGTIDALAPTDPARVAFNDLHGYSVMALGVAMLAALLALILIARRGD